MAESLITKHLDLWTSAIEAKSTAGRGSSKKFDLYGIKKLRELILELAATGRLIKSSQNNYEVLESLVELIMGQAPPGSECNTDGLGTVFVKTGEFGSLYPEVKEWTTKPLKFSRIGDVLICVVGATIGKLNLGIDCAIGRSVAALRPNNSKIETRFLYYSMHPFTNRVRNEAKGSAQGVIGKEILNRVRIRVPDLPEQMRIVAKVDELMALCDQLEQQTLTSIEAHTTLVETLLATLTASADADELAQNWNRISENFDTLFTTEQSIDLLKQTILQLAVMGKLVPQDPTDEPASVLLEKIAAEKAQLIKDKKIKKEKPLPPISDDEKPFDVPQGWAWCRFGELGYDMGGGTPSKTNNRYWGGIIPWISPKDMKCEYITSSIDSVTESAIDENTIKIIPEKSLLMVVRGMILAHSFPTALTSVPLVINQDMKALVFTNIEPEYLLKITQAMKVTFVNLVDRSSHGTCKLVSEKLWSVPMAIPPIKEQKRILDVVNGVLGFAENLKQIITEQRKHKLKLSDIFSMQPYDI